MLPLHQAHGVAGAATSFDVRERHFSSGSLFRCSTIHMVSTCGCGIIPATVVVSIAIRYIPRPSKKPLPLFTTWHCQISRVTNWHEADTGLNSMNGVMVFLLILWLLSSTKILWNTCLPEADVQDRIAPVTSLSPRG